MKKLIMIAIAFVGLQTIAQQRPERPNRERAEKMSNMSAEDAATLKTKKMTLHLDLNESQQSKIYKLNLENVKKRKTFMAARKARKESDNATKPTQEERLQMMNAKLDHQIATKQQMKTILNEAQYEKWERAQMKMSQKKKGKRHEGHKKS
ncbi:hypothetical protein [Changchengzhania lutea]|uniref:hypothetical protein n=1 Tax=Changchengzhania lutea TaxID=2049305 RepID=UPI00115E234C|nr:hypothetical protein [Changchengzhania lutea]